MREIKSIKIKIPNKNVCFKYFKNEKKSWMCPFYWECEGWYYCTLFEEYLNEDNYDEDAGIIRLSICKKWFPNGEIIEIKNKQ